MTTTQTRTELLTLAAARVIAYPIDFNSGRFAAAVNALIINHEDAYMAALAELPMSQREGASWATKARNAASLILAKAALAA